MTHEPFAQIINILENIRPDVDFRSEKSIISDGIIDSMDLLRIMSDIEIRFNVKLDFNTITKEDFNSVENIEKLIEHLQYKKVD